MNRDVSHEIRDGNDYRVALQTLDKRSQPPAVLRRIMNAFESYRAARKVGWSRPWNKYGVRNFQSYRLDMERDGDLVEDARALLAAPAFSLDAETRAFTDELLAPAAREQLMGFLFFHESDPQPDQASDQEAAEEPAGSSGLREGVMLSLGRVNSKRRHRDRMDIVFEADVDGDAVSPPRRVTVYVDPYRGAGPPLYRATVPIGELPGAEAVFDKLKACYRTWGRDDPRLWDHWTSQYIDYFAPRHRAALHSHFPETGFEAAWRDSLSGR